MGLVDPMVALTDNKRRMTSPSSVDHRSRSRSRSFDCTQDNRSNKKRARWNCDKRQGQGQGQIQGLAIHSSTLTCARNDVVSKSEGKPIPSLPPPTPLKREVQGPHRLQITTTQPKLFQKKEMEREEESSRPRQELEEEWNRPYRYYEEVSDLKALQNYKRRIDALQANFAYADRNHNKGPLTQTHGGVQEQCVHIDIDVDHNNKNVSEREDKAEGNDQPLYKCMLEKTNERNFKLRALDLEIELATAKLQALQFTKKDKLPFPTTESDIEKQKLVALHDAFVPLKDDEEAEVARALKGRDRRKVWVMHENSNIEITGEILQCLVPNAWLNDEVINLYFELLKERETREPNKFLKCHFFNTFFYKKLYNPKTKYDYKAVSRWTTQRKLGYNLIDCDKIFVPIHKEIHWCLAIIDMRAKKFQYLDSLKGRDAHVLQVLAKYIEDEAKDKTDQYLDVNTWKKEIVEDLPVQENGSDCGMFMIKYTDFHTQGLPLKFSQVDMPYFRKRTAKEILRLRAE